MMPTESPRRRLLGLDWVRGAAALWVLLYHVDITLQKTKYFDLQPLSLFTSVGYRGVELFFLLSGFVMAKAYNETKGNSWVNACAFTARRLLRIMPAYWVLFIPLFMLAVWKGIGSPPNMPLDVQLFFSNLLLLPRDNLTTYIPVSGWTLTHELMFYAVFMTSFISWRFFMCLMSIWAVVSLSCTVLGIQIDGWQMITSGLNAYFLLGIFCARLIIRPTLLRKIGLPLMALLCLLAAISLEGNGLDGAKEMQYAMQLSYAAAFALVICVFASEDLRLPTIIERVANYLGRISYGIYLVNYPVVVAVTMVCKAVGLRSQITLVVLSLAMAMTILLADLLHRNVEQPAIVLGKRLFGRWA